jgi:hypothetical protein
MGGLGRVCSGRGLAGMLIPEALGKIGGDCGMPDHGFTFRSA